MKNDPILFLSFDGCKYKGSESLQQTQIFQSQYIEPDGVHQIFQT